MAVVGGPPVLGLGHQRAQILLDGLEIEGREFLGVVVVAPHRVGLGRVLAQRMQIEALRPPVGVGIRGGVGGDRAHGHGQDRGQGEASFEHGGLLWDTRIEFASNNFVSSFRLSIKVERQRGQSKYC
ncbi:hypothetical protein D3C78_1561650 [compost metagenome]